jgi:aldehyde:ferredoxin oxidoreductase
MGTMYGASGKLLRVDLTSRKITTEDIPEILFKRYLGGNTLALYYLLKEQKAGIDPLSPEAMLIFMTSFLTGTPGPGLSRFAIVAKSPLTGGFGESEAGGWWGPELKFAGYEGIIFTGKADKPVYLAIKDDQVELRSADHIWGKKLREASDTIKQEMGDSKSRVALIGFAGEKMSTYANVINEMKHASGRLGMGAVLGSKNLKAVAVRGTTRTLPLYNEEKAKAITRESWAEYKEIPNTFPKLGTMRGVRAAHDVGVLPTYNWQHGVFDDYENLTEVTFMKDILKGTGTCYRCPIACKRESEITEGPYQVQPDYGGSEYETTASFGSICGVNDLKPISAAHQICQEYGMDTISAGVAIAWVMECYEKGLISKDKLDGLEMKFGDADNMLAMLKKMCTFEGVGAVLNQGFKASIDFFGAETAEYAMHVKNSPLPAHDPRGKASLSLAYAVSSSGPDHMEVQHDHITATPGGCSLYEPIGFFEPLEATDLSAKKVRQFFFNQALYNSYNSVGVCYFCVRPNGPFTINGILEYMRAVTGWQAMSLWNMMKIGEKHNTMSRLFNIREGLSAADDTLPERFFEPLEGGGPCAGNLIDRKQFEDAKKTYYAFNLWDEKGVPTAACLYQHELDWLLE